MQRRDQIRGRELKMSFSDKITPSAPQAGNIVNDLINDMKSETHPLFLWGCGEMAEFVYEFLKKNNITLSGTFVDASYYKKNQIFHGLPIQNLGEISKTRPSFNVIVGYICGNETLVGLKANAKNINKIYSIDIEFLYRIFGSVESIDYDFVSRNSDSFEWTYNQLTDELSKQSYIAYLNAKINKSYNEMAPHACKNTYFCDEIIQLTSNEIFLDCGAFTGDTIKNFMKNINDRHIQDYKRIYAFEPDEANYSKLSKLSKKMQNLYCIKKGAWNERATLQFDAQGSITSNISSCGKHIIEVDTIDNILLSEEGATFIKMDIEGSELNALMGAEQTILKHRPKLAICVYHKANDLITIPQYIKKLVPDYKLYIRAHTCTVFDLVLYAV
jgi:FkbM family methyltransferase